MSARQMYLDAQKAYEDDSSEDNMLARDRAKSNYRDAHELSVSSAKNAGKMLQESRAAVETYNRVAQSYAESPGSSLVVFRGITLNLVAWGGGSVSMGIAENAVDDTVQLYANLSAQEGWDVSVGIEGGVCDPEMLRGESSGLTGGPTIVSGQYLTDGKGNHSVSASVTAGFTPGSGTIVVKSVSAATKPVPKVSTPPLSYMHMGPLKPSL